MTRHKIVGIPGALRAASTNRLLVREAARVYGADEFIEADIRFPLLDEDLEEAEGIPAAVQTLADQIAEADAVVISTPEYNKNLPGVLKNALDWISRTEGNPWLDKPVSIVSAADGFGGGDRGTNSLVLCMMPFKSRLVYGPEVLIADSSNAFDGQGRLKSEDSLKFLEQLMGRLRAEVEDRAAQEAERRAA